MFVLNPPSYIPPGLQSSAVPTAIDAFSGSGGLSLGLQRAGFEIRAAFDTDEASIATYRRNNGPHGFVGDASQITGTELRSRAGLEGVELDLFAGGPPCQGFSKQKRGAHLGDPRNVLVLEYLRLVEELEPRAFLLENVPMMAQARGRHLVGEFESLSHYAMTGHYYVAADYGVAQKRVRFMLVGIRADVGTRFEVPAPTTPTWPTVLEAIGDLPEPPADGSPHVDVANHYAARISAINRERFSHVPQGGGWQDIPFDLRLPCHQRADTSQGGWPDVYGRLRADGQAPTITGGFDSFSRGRYGHPTSNRALTPREAARLQGYPDDFVFEGNRHEVRHQIGNAVPVSLAETVGRGVIDALNGDAPPSDLPLRLFQELR